MGHPRDHHPARLIWALLLAVLLLPLAAESTGTLTTPNVIGAQPRGNVSASLLDANWTQHASYINAREVTFDVCANRPVAGTHGRYYYCTDTSIFYGDTGSAWTALSSQPVYTDELTGLTLSNDATATATALNVAVGATASDDTTVANRVLMTVASATVGNLTGTWIAGNYQPKLDTGAVAANATYHVFVIQRTDTGNVDLLVSLSPTAPTMPTNYTKKRRVWSILTNASSNVVNFVQDGDTALWSLGSMALDVDVTNPGTAAVTRTLVNVPTGVKMTALCNVQTNHVGSQFINAVTSLDQPDLVPSETVSPLHTDNTSEAAPTHWISQVAVRTNTAAQIRTRQSASGAGDILKMFCYGYADRRGRG